MGSLQDELIKKGLSQQPVGKEGMKEKKNVYSQKEGGQKDKGQPISLCLPLYKDFKNFILMRDQVAKHFESSPHPGLVFDKFPCHWSGPDKWKDKTDTRKKQDVADAIEDAECWNPSPKRWFLNKVIQIYGKNSEIKNLLSAYHNRLDLLLSKINGQSHSFTTQWRFVTGLGMGHVLETGFVWHRILGVPYLPGTSIKGLIRAWADPRFDKDNAPRGWGDQDKWEEVKRLFGDSDDLGAGSLIVFDALPVAKPEMEVDIMNPHYAPYYENKKGEKPPADYYSPKPIFFLTVKKGMQFKFSLALRPGADQKSNDVARGFELLQCALENIGAGAKTAVGYGYFK